MINCPQCNTENPTRTNFCMHCGFAISESTEGIIQEHPIEKRTKRVRELEEKNKSLKRKNTKILEQNNEINNSIVHTKKENESLKKQLNEVIKQLDTKNSLLETRKENISVVVTIFLIFLIAIFVIKYFHV